MSEERLEEFEKVKELMKKYIKEAKCGLFHTRNTAGDSMTTLFCGKHFTLDHCYYYSYYEVFGTTEKEFKELQKYYKKIGGMV